MNQNHETPSADVLLRAIQKHCLMCSGGSKREVERCMVKECELRPYRTQKTLKTMMGGKLDVSTESKAGNGKTAADAGTRNRTKRQSRSRIRSQGA